MKVTKIDEENDKRLFSNISEDIECAKNPIDEAIYNKGIKSLAYYSEDSPI